MKPLRHMKIERKVVNGSHTSYLHALALYCLSLIPIPLFLCTLFIHISGKKSGLQSAKSLREENIRTKKLEDQRFSVMDHSVSGKSSSTIYRDKSGKKIDLVAEKRKKDELEKQKAVENAKYDKWKKG